MLLCGLMLMPVLAMAEQEYNHAFPIINSDVQTCHYPEECMLTQLQYDPRTQYCFKDKCSNGENVQCVNNEKTNKSVYFCAKDEYMKCQPGQWKRLSISFDNRYVLVFLESCPVGTYRQHQGVCGKTCPRRHWTNLDKNKYKLVRDGTSSAPALLKCNDQNNYCPVKQNHAYFNFTKRLYITYFCKEVQPGTDCLQDRTDFTRSALLDEKRKLEARISQLEDELEDEQATTV